MPFITDKEEFKKLYSDALNKIMFLPIEQRKLQLKNFREELETVVEFIDKMYEIVWDGEEPVRP